MNLSHNPGLFCEPGLSPGKGKGGCCPLSACYLLVGV